MCFCWVKITSFSRTSRVFHLFSLMLVIPYFSLRWENTQSLSLTSSFTPSLPRIEKEPGGRRDAGKFEFDLNTLRRHQSSLFSSPFFSDIKNEFDKSSTQNWKFQYRKRRRSLKSTLISILSWQHRHRCWFAHAVRFCLHSTSKSPPIESLFIISFFNNVIECWCLSLSFIPICSRLLSRRIDLNADRSSR